VKDDPMYYGHPDLPKTHSEMALPLVVGQRIIGVLDLQSTTESAFDEQDLEIMRTLADQVSIAIENARLFSETRHALSEARAVYGQYMRQSWEQLPDERSAYGYRYSGMKADPLHAPLDLSEIQAATQTGQMVAPTSKSPNIAVPLKLREEVIGVLDIRSANPSRQWSDNEIAVVQAVAERVALALENARLFEETTRRADRERTVSEITTRIRSTNDPQLMLKTALDELKRVLGADDILVRPYAAQSVQKQPSAKRIKPSQPVKQDKVSR